MKYSRGLPVRLLWLFSLLLLLSLPAFGQDTLVQEPECVVDGNHMHLQRLPNGYIRVNGLKLRPAQVCDAMKDYFSQFGYKIVSLHESIADLKAADEMRLKLQDDAEIIQALKEENQKLRWQQASQQNLQNQQLQYDANWNRFNQNIGTPLLNGIFGTPSTTTTPTYRLRPQYRGSNNYIFEPYP